mmetsp:Transcript_36741/g.63120  ORF Transcript_36741/g.63120 Transcript_36741/m.63120 type:complete len:105 (-) Transcript_36741:75-389(-)
MASSLRSKFEQAANESAQSKRGALASSWDNGDEKPLPSTKTASGDPSASGLKAKFERMANPPPPKKTMGKVAWKGEADQGRKKSHIPGQDHTKPPPPRSLDSLP